MLVHLTKRIVHRHCCQINFGSLRAENIYATGVFVVRRAMLLNSLDVALQFSVALQKRKTESSRFTDSRCHFTTPSCACAVAALLMLFMFWFVAVVVFVAAERERFLVGKARTNGIECSVNVCVCTCKPAQDTLEQDRVRQTFVC